MTALPAKLLLPEANDIGLSVASLVLAESAEEQRENLAELWSAIDTARAAYATIATQYAECETEFATAEPADLMLLMERARVGEERSRASYEKLFALVRKRRFREVVDASSRGGATFGIEHINEYLDEWSRKLLSLIRAIRASCVVEIFRRAAILGIEEARLDRDFQSRFLAMPPTDADAWQETAHLLAGPDNALFLTRTVAAVSSAGEPSTLGGALTA